MENEPEIIEIKPKNMYFSICITQLICVATIVIAIVVIKLFFKDSYKEIKNWCQTNLFEHTQITADFDEVTTSEI